MNDRQLIIHDLAVMFTRMKYPNMVKEAEYDAEDFLRGYLKYRKEIAASVPDDISEF